MKWERIRTVKEEWRVIRTTKKLYMMSGTLSTMTGI